MGPEGFQERFLHGTWHLRREPPLHFLHATLKGFSPRLLHFETFNCYLSAFFPPSAFFFFFSLEVWTDVVAITTPCACYR